MDPKDQKSLPPLTECADEAPLEELVHSRIEGTQGPVLVLDGGLKEAEAEWITRLLGDAGGSGTSTVTTRRCEPWSDLQPPAQPWAAILVLPLGSGAMDPELWRRLALSVDRSSRIVLVGWLTDRPWEDPSRDPISRQHLLATLAGQGFRLQKRHDLTARLVDAPPEQDRFELLELRFDGHCIREIREGDLPALLDLFTVSFHHQRSEDHWRWKYERNPWGRHRVTVIESPQGEVVGQYCAYPVPLYDAASGRRRLCHQVGDTMTAQAVRSVGRGPTSLLARSAQHFYARHCEQSIALNFGFNTGNIQKFSRLYVGAHPVWDAPFLERELESTSLPERSLRSRLFKRYRLEEIDELSDATAAELDRLFDEVAPRYGLLIERRARYLRWRYLDCPDADYRFYLARRGDRLVGWSVFRHREAQPDRPSRLVWGDALLDPTEAQAALDLVARAAIDSPAQRLTAWFSAVPEWWQPWLARLGLERRPEPDALGMVVVPFCWADPVPTLRERYYCTMGDGDLF